MVNKIIKIWPVIIIVFIWFIFSSPFFIKGLVPYASLYQSNFFAPWSAYSVYEGPVKNNAMPDIITQIYPWRNFTVEMLKEGQIPLWNPYSFAGTPHLANYQSAPLFPLNMLFFLPLNFLNAWSLLVLLQPLLAAFGMYIFLKSLKLSNSASTAGAISFMFCGFLTTWMGYATLGYAILILPFALFSINKFFENSKVRYLILLSFVIPFSFFAGHFQTSIYFFLAVLSYLVFVSLEKRALKKFVFTFLFFLSGVLIAMPQVLPSIEFYLHSVRQEIITQLEVIPLMYLPTLFAPDFFGNPVTRNDWFGHYAEWNGFAGTISVILAIFASIFLWRKDRRILFFVLLGIASVLVAFDTPINLLIFKLNLPLFSTSASSRIIVLLSFAISVLSAYAVHYLISDLKNYSKKQLIFIVSIVLIILLSLWVIPLTNFLNDLEKTQIAKSNLILPTLVSLVFAFSAVCLFFLKKIKFIPVLFLIVVLGLIFFDMLRFSTKWMPFDPKDLVFKEVGVTKFYMQNSTEKRYLGNLSAENAVFYKIQLLGGYDPLYIKRYGEFVKYIDLGRIEGGDRSVVNFPLSSVRTKKAIDYLGVEYIPQKKSDDGKVWSFDFSSYPTEEFEIVYEDEAYRVFRNKNSFPRAFVVSDYDIEKEDSEILNKMFDDSTDLRAKVILEKDPKISKNKSLNASANIIDYEPNSIKIEVNSENNALLLLTDNYYPGWKAYIDGREVEILRANYTFRAIVVPEGKSVVEFKYLPQSFKIGTYSAGFGLIIIVALSLLINRKVRYGKN
jgi:hypothetical protein